MTHEQYSTIQRKLGILEGIGAALENELATLFYDTIVEISNIVEDLKPETGSGEGKRRR